MPKLSEGKFALGGLAVLAIWTLVVLPLLYQEETSANPIVAFWHGRRMNQSVSIQRSSPSRRYCSGPSRHWACEARACCFPRQRSGRPGCRPLRPELQLEALAHHAGKESARRMLLPARGFHHRGNRRTRGRLQHCDDARLLRARIGFMRPRGIGHCQRRRLCGSRFRVCWSR